MKKLLKKTDALRRKMTRKTINLLGFFGKNKEASAISPKKVKRVLICRPNHRLGNQLLITPLVQEVENTFPNAKIDLFLKGNLGKFIFENYPNVDRLIILPKKHFKNPHTYIHAWFALKTRRYDLVINSNADSSSGRLAMQMANASYRFMGEEITTEQPNDYHHFAKTIIYQLRQAFKTPENDIPSLALNLRDEEVSYGRTTLDEINKNHKPTIGIYTYATLDKCYAPEFWLPFYKALQEKYGKNYNIIEILPIENISQINFTAPHYYSRDIRELSAVMNAMKIFISGDCGMMHLACASKIPVIGLFKSASVEKYQPYGNQSLGISTKDLNAEKIFSEIDSIIS